MGLYRSLKRDVSKEWNVSRNRGEPWMQGGARAVLCSWFLCKALLLGVRSLFRECLGSQVIYNDRKCFVSNWAGSEYPTLAAEGFYQQYVPRSDIRNVINLKELWHRFTFGVTFYTGYHMDNDINKRMYPAAFHKSDS